MKNYKTNAKLAGVMFLVAMATSLRHYARHGCFGA